MNKSALKDLLKKLVGNKEKRHKIIVATTSWMSDKAYLKLLYKFICKKSLPLDNPETFNEKLQWYKLHYRNPLMTKCADKLEVRDYVKEKGMGDMLVPLLFKYDSVAEIDFDKLPEKCILKCTHNSSGSFKWNKERKNDTEQIRKCFKDMLSINAYWLSREWAYKDIKPRIVCEKWIESATPIADIKFLCFGGKAQFIYYDVGMNDEFGNHAIGHRAVLDRELNVCDVDTSMKRLPKEKLVLPENIQEIIAYADKLSEPFPQVRVDFFLADSKAYFSELTFYSGGGYGDFNPKEWDKKIGNFFVLPDSKDKYYN